MEKILYWLFANNSKKKGVYWRIQESLYLKDTKIFQFDPLEAEKIESKDGNPT